jgi:histone H3/H4
VTRLRASIPLLGLVCVLSGAAACASTKAQTRSDPTPLEIPEPPPRLIEPLPEVAEMPPPEPERRDPVPPAPRLTRPPRDAGQASRSEPKPDPAKTPDPIPAVEVPPPAAPRAELRTPDPVDDQGVREILDRASKALGRVDYRKLAKEAQEQYNTATRFMEQAKEALQARNQIAAKYLAEKADTIAKELTGR